MTQTTEDRIEALIQSGELCTVTWGVRGMSGERVAWVPAERCTACRKHVTGKIGEETTMGWLGPRDPNSYHVSFACGCGHRWTGSYRGLRGDEPRADPLVEPVA